MNLILAMAQSLYSVRFYRQVLPASLAKGFLYLALWAAVFSMLVSMVVVVRFLPEANRFLEWFRQEMPVLEWTPEGMTINRPSPYVMKHPRYGHVATFDLSKEEAGNAEIGDALFFLTSSKLYVRQNARNEVRVYDLKPADAAAKAKAKNFVLDAAKVRQFERSFKPLMILILAVGTFFIFFIWKMIAALFYSLIALLINLFRQSRLPYESLLNVSFFAMTASIWITILQLFAGGIFTMPLGFLGSALLTTIYLYLAIKLTEDSSPPMTA